MSRNERTRRQFIEGGITIAGLGGLTALTIQLVKLSSLHKQLIDDAAKGHPSSVTTEEWAKVVDVGKGLSPDTQRREIEKLVTGKQSKIPEVSDDQRQILGRVVAQMHERQEESSGIQKLMIAGGVPTLVAILYHAARKR